MEQGSNRGPGSQEQPVVSEAQKHFALNRLRDNQNLPAGVLAGAVAALVGASIWAFIAVFAEYQTGLVAIGVGFLVGYAVRLAGKGIDRIFGVVGAIFALLGCLLGKLLTTSYLIAKQEGTPFLDVLAQMDFGTVLEIMVSTFEPMDILFYAIAVYFGYRYAFRPVTAEDLGRS